MLWAMAQVYWSQAYLAASGIIWGSDTEPGYSFVPPPGWSLFGDGKPAPKRKRAKP